MRITATSDLITLQGSRGLGDAQASLVIFDCDGVLVDSERLAVRLGAEPGADDAACRRPRTSQRSREVEAALLEEWARTQPGLPARSRDAAGTARKAWRFAGEMDQVAACFAEAGLPDGFARAAAVLYRRLAAFKDVESDPQLSEVLGRVHGQGGS